MSVVRLKNVRRLGWWKQREDSLPGLSKGNYSVWIDKLNNGWHRVSVSSLGQTQLHIYRLHVILGIHSRLHRELTCLLSVRIRYLSYSGACILYFVTVSVHIELYDNTVLSTITWIADCYWYNVVESETLLVYSLKGSTRCRAALLHLGLFRLSMLFSHLVIVLFLCG